MPVDILHWTVTAEITHVKLSFLKKYYANNFFLIQVLYYMYFLLLLLLLLRLYNMHNSALDRILKLESKMKNIYKITRKH